MGPSLIQYICISIYTWHFFLSICIELCVQRWTPNYYYDSTMKRDKLSSKHTNELTTNKKKNLRWYLKTLFGLLENGYFPCGTDLSSKYCIVTFSVEYFRDLKTVMFVTQNQSYKRKQQNVVSYFILHRTSSILKCIVVRRKWLEKKTTKKSVVELGKHIALAQTDEKENGSWFSYKPTTNNWIHKWKERSGKTRIRCHFNNIRMFNASRIYKIFDVCVSIFVQKEKRNLLDPMFVAYASVFVWLHLRKMFPHQLKGFILSLHGTCGHCRNTGALLFCFLMIFSYLKIHTNSNSEFQIVLFHIYVCTNWRKNMEKCFNVRFFFFFFFHIHIIISCSFN